MNFIHSFPIRLYEAIKNLKILMGQRMSFIFIFFQSYVRSLSRIPLRAVVNSCKKWMIDLSLCSLMLMNRALQLFSLGHDWKFVQRKVNICSLDQGTHINTQRIQFREFFRQRLLEVALIVSSGESVCATTDQNSKERDIFHRISERRENQLGQRHPECALANNLDETRNNL